jgi:hypothetical protein
MEGSTLGIQTLDDRAALAIPRPQLRPAGKACIALLAFLGLGAMGGGLMLVSDPDGSGMQWNVSMLAGSPFSDFLIPGLILAGLFGLGSIATIALGLVRARVAPFVAFALGCGLMIWIVVELAVIKELSFLHPVMFITGLLIALSSWRWGWPTFIAWRLGR